MKKLPLIAVLAAMLAVFVAVLAFKLYGDAGTDQDFRAFDEVDTARAAEPTAEPAPGPPTPALPDPRLAREKLWEEKLDGPTPPGFGSHFVQHEKALHGVFRRAMGDTIELCLDEMRRRGERYDGELTFHVTAVPRPDLKMRFRLNGIKTEAATTSGTNGATAGLAELPPDVYQCIWDSVEALEFRLPPLTIGIFSRAKQPELFVPYEVREHSPAGPIDADEMMLDAGAAPALPEESAPASSEAGADAGVIGPDADPAQPG